MDMECTSNLDSSTKANLGVVAFTAKVIASSLIEIRVFVECADFLLLTHVVWSGTLVTAEGTYTGSWAEDRKEGKGKWESVNGEIYDGEWHSDQVISSCCTCMQ